MGRCQQSFDSWSDCQNMSALVDRQEITIVPNPDGNCASFVKVPQRVLLAARKQGDGQIAFADNKGKIMIKASNEADMIEWDVNEAG